MALPLRGLRGLGKGHCLLKVPRPELPSNQFLTWDLVLNDPPLPHLPNVHELCKDRPSSWFHREAHDIGNKDGPAASTWLQICQAMGTRWRWGRRLLSKRPLPLVLTALRQQREGLGGWHPGPHSQGGPMLLLTPGGHCQNGSNPVWGPKVVWDLGRPLQQAPLTGVWRDFPATSGSTLQSIK